MGKERSVSATILMVIGAVTVVVVAIAVLVPLVSGFVHGGDRNKMFGGESRVDTTKLKLKRYAFEAYPSWLAAHPNTECPGTLADLNEYMNSDDTNDSWGNPLKMLCGGKLPPGARGIAVISAGADNRVGTEDDLKSWE